MSPGFGSGGARRGERDAAAEADRGGAAYWRALKEGDFVALSDAEAFEASLSGAGSSGSLDYQAAAPRSFALRGREPSIARGPGNGHASARAIDRGNGRGAAAALELGAYRFVELRREGSGPLYLALVDLEPSSGPESFELRLYFVPEGIEPGTRDEFIDRGDSWLFLPPPDPEDFLSKDLEYAPYPDLPPIDGRKLVFSRTGSGPLYAEALDTGAPSIIAEYEAEEEGVANPLLLVLEEGWMKADGSEPEEGGYLSLMLGKRLRPGEIEHWPA